ncbi:hypothetical protein [Thiocapsa rosea]|uniref:Uncharacterized protein n=1 Tax=Thiocapsa rosea TaxID=69360 RepID=A0A495V4D9_9GAMM|nr:hypothetical protein [Thiocapsa rosea]RKT43540.1 hypothetical protein BDD21_0878 [Thiocapsa rosea]
MIESLLLTTARVSTFFGSQRLTGASGFFFAGDARLPWKLLGVHSARLDMSGGDMRAEESLGLNCAWYADILLTLTTGNHAR